MYSTRRRLTFCKPASTLFLGLSALLVTATSPLWAVTYTDGETNTNAYEVNSGDTLPLSIDSGRATQSGLISGLGGVEKLGAGTLVLIGENTYAGGTLLTEGMLRLDFSASIGPESPIGTGMLTFNGGSIGTADLNDFVILDNNVLANDHFTIDVQGQAGAIEFFGSVDLGPGTREITLTGEGLACFGGAISGNNIKLMSTAELSQVMFCSDTTNTFIGTLEVGENIILELEKITDNVAISGNLQINDGATVMVWGENQFSTSSAVFVNGTLDLTSGGENTIGSLWGVGTVTSDVGDHLSIGVGVFGGTITGNVKLTKETTETLVLTGTSTYTGGTSIIDGVLQVTTNKALGTGSVTITNGGILMIDRGVALDIGVGNTISIANDGETIYRKVYDSGESLANFNELTSQGAFGTKADILGGTAGAARTVDATFSTTPFDVPTNDGARVSEIFTLTGTATETFVLQLSYAVDPEGLLIARLVGDEWVSLGTGTFVEGAWNSSYTAVGTYGIDTASNTVWAITDQAGAFAVIPEPSTVLLLGLAAAFVLFRARRVVA